MPKAKWNLNTIYISERLQESLRPISRCALTTVVAPMGYGKTTAVEWFLAERARAEEISVIRISVYSANLAIFWRSVQDAFARAGFDLLRDYDCPSDAAGGGLLIEDLCHALAGERACYIFLDDFHLLTSRRAAWSLCALAARLPANVHLILATFSCPPPPSSGWARRSTRSASSSSASTIPSSPSTSAAAAPSFPMSRSSPCCITARAGSPPSI